MRRPVLTAVVATLAAAVSWLGFRPEGLVDLVGDEPVPPAAYSAGPGKRSVPPPHEPGRVPRPDPEWVQRTADAAGLPGTALAAYARASLMAPEECRIGWTTLAGVGWVESHHGTIGGAILRLDGTSTMPIAGPALDGRGPNAAIRATPAGRELHGDPTWEHAVGPMQLLPTTWGEWTADGDGDGERDPHDLDDAALAAARFLCARGGDLATPAGWDRAVLAYNPSRAYVEAVRSASSSYAADASRR